jgi:hypothetical protein
MLCGLNPITIERLKEDLCKLGPNLTTNYIKQLALNYNCLIWTIYRHKAYVEAGMPLRRALGGL